MINLLWAGMILAALAAGLWKLLFEHDLSVFTNLTTAIFQNAQNAVEISIGLAGILSFWLGILKLVEQAGLAEKISQKLTPLFRLLMKDIPENSPAISTVVLNMAANFLGLDNAATLHRLRLFRLRFLCTGHKWAPPTRQRFLSLFCLQHRLLR